MKWKVVYFDDDVNNIECYKLMLQDKFNLLGYEHALEYKSILKEHSPHAFLIDVHMPEIDGFELYQGIINHPSYNGCPIFFISGDQSDQNKIKSLQQGGIDFFERNISEEEMTLRLSNRIQVFQQMSTIIELGNLKIDAEIFKVFINQIPVDLTLIELRMLSALLRSFPQPISKIQMLKKIWGDEDVKPGTINTHLTNLRSKIEGWSFSIKVKEENILIQKI